MKKILYLLLVVTIFFLASCEEDKHGPTNSDSAPAPVTDVVVERLPGGAKFIYNTPKDENLLYVKAVYTLADGTVRETKSSYYTNNLVVEGFPDTAVYKADIYSVSRGENMSSPVSVEFKPMLSPIQVAFESLRMKATFGGVSVAFKNDYEANLRFSVVTKNELDEIVPADNYYTKRKEGNFAVRGYKAEDGARYFGVYISDKWNNKTALLSDEITPIPEVELDKKKFKTIQLPSDVPNAGHISSNLARLWDGNWGQGKTDGNSIFHTKPGSGLPQWFTFDLGVTARFSRMKVYHRYGTNYDGCYAGGDPKTYEIYGSNTLDYVNDSWDQWTLLMQCLSVKPSGEPAGTVTTEDLQFAAVDGEEFEFPEGLGAYRYIRVKILKVWGTLDHIYLSELGFWGQQ